MNDFREAWSQLVTSVALITTIGRHGPNVMSAEWTFQVSYWPPRLIVLVHPRDATYDNLKDTDEFGANFLSEAQATLASLAGFYTGKETSKLSSDLCKTYPAKKIQAPMITECFLNAECRVSQAYETGDHTMFVGDILDVQFDPEKSPLLYTRRRYWSLGEQLHKKPLVYVTCTVRNGQIRVDGRLQGPDAYPTSVEVKISHAGNGVVFEEAVEADERGYFELIRKLKTDNPKGMFLAEARWRDLKGTASTRLE